jgi:hypothetical protein
MRFNTIDSAKGQKNMEAGRGNFGGIVILPILTQVSKDAKKNNKPP